MLLNFLQRSDMNMQETLNYISEKLEKFYNNKQQAQQYARWTLETITGQPIANLISKPIIITSEIKTKIEYWLTQLIEHEEPIQYLIGTVPFGPIEIFVKHPVLIPRPETEEWVIALASQIKKNIGSETTFTVLDACTGSGCIALLLGFLFPKAEIIGIDIADHAIDLAKQNKAQLKLSNVTFLKGDITTYQPEKAFDLIVSNPPYIDHDDWLDLSPSVTAWEDYHALVADDNGYALIETVINNACNLLKKESIFSQSNSAQLIIEIGHNQGKKVLEYAQHNKNFKKAQINKDYAGQDRVLYIFK